MGVFDRLISYIPTAKKNHVYNHVFIKKEAQMARNAEELYLNVDSQ